MFLRVFNGPHAGRVFDCSLGPLVLGRRMPPSHVLLVDEPSVSRGAIRIERLDDQFVLVDHSENGSFVNGKHVFGAQVPLVPGDTIQIGETRLQLSSAQ